MATYNPWTAEIARINAAIKLTEINIARDQALLAANPSGPDAARLRTQIESGQNYLVDLGTQLDQFVTEYNNYGKDPNQSSGQILVQEQLARTQGSVTQNPPPLPEFVQSSTGLNILPEDLETGTDGRIRLLSETQATPQPILTLFATRDDDGNLLPPIPSLNSGAGAPGDDNSGRNTASVQQTINANFSQRIDPRPNILDQYASYTYSLTWYLLTPEQYKIMTQQNKKNISGWQILVQSAGAPVAPGNGLPGRNQFFSNDYYIDNMVIEQALAGKGTGAAQNSLEISFSVIEPNGFTLIENLYRAVSTYYKQNNVTGGPTAYQTAQYVLAIRFYGYNEFGELVQVGKNTNPGGGTPGPAVSTDVRAVVEKFLPFGISNIDTKIVSRSVEYQIKAIGTPYVTAFSSQRGTIPFDYELAGSTVGEVLNGRPVGTKYTRTEGRVDTPQPPSSNPTSPVNPGNQAGVNEFGNFTGDTQNPFTVVAP